jgi:peptidoglycan/LPS O-acetylase OafA/YrhL
MIVCILLLPLVKRTSGVVMSYYGHTLLTVCFALITINILLNIGSNAIWVRCLRSRKLRFLGKVSYSLYLFHPVILATAFLIAGYKKTLAGWPQAFLIAGSLACSLVFSNMLFNLLESRLIGLGRKIPY